MVRIDAYPPSARMEDVLKALRASPAPLSCDDMVLAVNAHALCDWAPLHVLDDGTKVITLQASTAMREVLTRLRARSLVVGRKKSDKERTVLYSPVLEESPP